MGEDQLVARLRRGEAAAFDAIYARTHRRIYNFLVRLSGRRDVAEDLFQETWLKLARHAPKLRDDSDVEAWLFAVARNLYFSHVRGADADDARDDSAELADEGAPPEQQAAARLDLARLERALAELPAAAREVLLLVAVDGMDQERAAQVLGIGYDAVRQRLTRARALLVERLGDGDRAVAGGDRL